jgi:5-methyltetrahydrofolate--homocysteine methyltransferase
MLMDGEREALEWASGCVREALDTGIAFDSPDIDLLLDMIAKGGSWSILNSLTCDTELLERALPVLADSGAAAIVMLKSREGVPEDPDGRLALARRAADLVDRAGIEHGQIFFDPVLTPVATTSGGLTVALETINGLKRDLPRFERIGGLSNISFGLPMRKLLNRSFLPMALFAGLTAVICDPTDQRLMETIAGVEVVLGLDPGCRSFLELYRSRK